MTVDNLKRNDSSYIFIYTFIRNLYCLYKNNLDNQNKINEMLHKNIKINFVGELTLLPKDPKCI